MTQIKIPHDSASLHVTGEATYINDMLVNNQLLYGHVVYSKKAHAKFKLINLDEISKIEGVIKVLTYKDIPGHNNFGPIIHDELCLAVDEVFFIGQAMVLIAATSREIALLAEKQIIIEYEDLETVLDIDTAIAKNALLANPRKIERGNFEQAYKLAPNKIEGTLNIGGQEHWYLETQTCLCVPDELDGINVFASTQNPTETQILVAEVLGITSKDVVVETKRLGGGFGGKETQGNHVACWCALLAKATKRPVKIHLFRDDDQKITGKRHRFKINYKAAYTNEGLLQAVLFEQNADAGSATDLTMSILERAMLHAENAYYIPNIRIIGKAWKTNLPSNTAYRGFGGPQGIAAMETIIDRIARNLKKDATEIRILNFYKTNENNYTPYNQLVENNRLQIISDQLIEKSNYYQKRKAVNEFNNKNRFTKRGIAFTPVKFGISFTTAFLNQAGALVNIYKDGSVLVSHGGTEMGQGLFVKIQQIAAAELGIDLDKIKVTATNTSKVPNTSPTAASSGTDLNGMAVKNAIDKLKARISEAISVKWSKDFNTSCKSEDIIFENNYLVSKKNNNYKISFTEAIQFSYFNQISLGATGFYKTPEIFFDREKGFGKPFHYFSYGAAVSEIELDILTGRHKILSTNILFDVGDSINKDIDLGQIIGGFVQGIGWCTTEEMKYDKNGNLLNHSPDTYKIPTIQDIPMDLKVDILEGYPNVNTIRRSKAIGEPPFMLAFSVWLAIKDAISSIGEHNKEPEFSIPTTNEQILLSIENLIHN